MNLFVDSAVRAADNFAGLGLLVELRKRSTDAGAFGALIAGVEAQCA
jgi:hypothetical protein